MALVIRVLRCTCGKAHCCAGIGPNTRCACGAALWQQMWRSAR